MNDKRLRRIAVMAGGYSGEAEISLRSAQMVMEHIDGSRYDAVLVHIDRNGWWSPQGARGNRTEVDPKSLSLTLDGGETWQAELAFVMVHGTPGEDGVLQTQLEAQGMPCTTADSEAMALTFHKGRTTSALRDALLPVAASIDVAANESWSAQRCQEVADTLGLPCFVKPNEAGSSLGISKASTAADIWPAVCKAREAAQSSVLVEAALTGREFTCGIVPDDHGKHTVLPVTEIRTDNDFFDFDAKYKGQSQEITPAPLEEADTVRLQETAWKVYQTLNLRGMARVDMMMVPGAVPHVIEVNTVPGFSAQSIIPHQAAKVGISKQSLITRIIEASWPK